MFCASIQNASASGTIHFALKPDPKWELIRDQGYHYLLFTQHPIKIEWDKVLFKDDSWKLEKKFYLKNDVLKMIENPKLLDKDLILLKFNTIFVLINSSARKVGRSIERSCCFNLREQSFLDVG